MGIGWCLGLNASQLKKGIESFTGVERRFDIKRTEHPVYIDDYAHHPEEIRVTIEAIRMLYPNKRITGVFQPHLYSRTKDFVNEFAEELSKLDKIILLEIYPAREKPIEGISSKMILDKIVNPDKKILSKKELLEHLKKFELDILLTIGAGDIGLLVNEIDCILKQR
jgi:UDP-N-acetylmuramate--alanine ligase